MASEKQQILTIKAHVRPPQLDVSSGAVLFSGKTLLLMEANEEGSKEDKDVKLRESGLALPHAMSSDRIKPVEDLKLEVFEKEASVQVINTSDSLLKWVVILYV